MNIKLYFDDGKPLIFYKEDKLYQFLLKEPKFFKYRKKDYYLQKSIINLNSLLSDDDNFIELYYKEKI